MPEVSQSLWYIILVLFYADIFNLSVGLILACLVGNPLSLPPSLPPSLNRCKKGTRVYAMYPQTTSLYSATVIDNTTYCREDDDVVVVEFDGEEPGEPSPT